MVTAPVGRSESVNCLNNDVTAVLTVKIDGLAINCPLNNGVGLTVCPIERPPRAEGYFLLFAYSKIIGFTTTK